MWVTVDFFYDDSCITVPVQLTSAMHLLKILFKTATFRVKTAAKKSAVFDSVKIHQNFTIYPYSSSTRGWVGTSTGELQRNFSHPPTFLDINVYFFVYGVYPTKNET